MTPHAEKYRQLSLKISYYRKQKGYTQYDLAELIPISRGHLSLIEAPNSPRSFSMETLFDIADVLGVSVKDLFDFEYPNTRKEAKDEDVTRK